MALPAEDILQAFFGTSVLDTVSIEQLQEVAEKHPYYGTAHFLLAKKLYDSKEEGMERALQKAVLHFPDELLLHFNLNYTSEAAEKAFVPAADSKETEAINGTATTSSVENLPEAGLLLSEVTEDVTPGNEFLTESLQQPELDDDVLPEEDALHPVDSMDVIIQDKLSNLLQEQAAEFEKPVEPTAEIPVEITPAHRIDYFESQGIRLEEDKGTDKLGAQLRRFTDWLKQMKRINPNPYELKSDEAGEHEVQDRAQHSNEPEEIVTETMAEVLIKQGKLEHAKEIYEKLSFINPSKSVYFAAKIEELKS